MQRLHQIIQLLQEILEANLDIFIRADARYAPSKQVKPVEFICEDSQVITTDPWCSVILSSFILDSEVLHYCSSLYLARSP